MTAAQWILTALVALGTVYWLLNAWFTWLTLRRVPTLEDLPAPEPSSWPKVTLIIAACNEADTIEAATRSRLSDDYPDVEIVLVDDRSDDGTSEIVERLAAADDRVRALHLTELPDGWLGKLHAMHRGVAIATGEWLLFTDADVHVKPGTLRHAVACCLQRGLDYLAVIPEFWPPSFLLGCAMASFFRFICLGTRVWATENPRSTGGLGVGAFNLVRRAAFARTAGFEELRLTVGDDVGLARMLKQSGALCAIANGRGRIGLRFYRTLADAARGAEKSVLLAFQFSFVRFAITLLAMLWLELSPVVALVAGAFLSGSVNGASGSAGAGPAGAVLLVLGAAGLACALYAAISLNHWVRGPALPAAFFPVGILLTSALTVRAAVLAAWRGGHMWRGVIYPNELLRAGNRLRFP
jgi:hypothetical protein